MGLFHKATFVQRFGEPFYDSVRRAIQGHGERYQIRPVYAGVFGSQAKGCAGPFSDIDLYVVYLGPVRQYAKLLDVDTKQVAEEDRLPPQITLPSVYRGEERLTEDHPPVQLNFVSLDFFVREIGKNNLDFRIGQDNLIIDFMGYDSLIRQIDTFAASTFDPEKVRHTCAGRARRVMHSLRDLVDPDPRPSELVDALYRLFLAWAVTNTRFISKLVLNQTLTLAELMDGYLEDVGEDKDVAFMRRNLIPHLHDGLFRNAHPYWHNSIIEVIGRIEPLIMSRKTFVVPAHLAERGIEHYLKQADALNVRFAEMLLEGAQ